MTVADLILSPQELERITGYRRPAAQLAELHRQGFYRARRLRTTGAVVLERDHYHAVCAGQAAPAPEPKLRPPRLRAA
ncbi:MAG: DUF4224 domain-containing protein [Mycobacterium sp.]|nr:DUF4224 domain-containing protein [Mycobacterium sp.]